MRQEKEKSNLFIPWSSRESFTCDVCDLVSDEKGCRRFRTLENHPYGHHGVAPLNSEAARRRGEVCLWVVFRGQREPHDEEFLVASPTLTTQVIAGSAPPSRDSQKNEILFGFSLDGLKTPVPVPAHIRFRCGQDDAIESWEAEDPKGGLQGAFGSDTFSTQRIELPAIGSNPARTLHVSIADLLNATLDGRCDRRRHALGMEVGITQCHIETALLWETENVRWDDVSITCSYIAPENGVLRTLGYLDKAEALNIGGLASRSPGIDLASLITPITAATHRTDVQPDAINYADALTSAGRYHILPTETSRSYLRFGSEEVRSYLVHWLLLRIFADERNAAFVARFRAWPGRFSALDDVCREFDEILNQTVLLFPDPYVFRVRGVPETQRSGAARKADADGALALLIDGGPAPFRRFLAAIGLATDAGSLAGLRSLRDWFDTGTSDVRSLPMFSRLEWLRPMPFGTDDSCDEGTRLLGEILSCYRHAAGLRPREDQPYATRRELEAHVRRCVFPIGLMVATMPTAENWDFFIFPIWEENLQDWHRPVIFAHAWHARRSSAAAPDTERGDNDIATSLQRLLLPLGPAIAHHYYARLQQRESEAMDRLLIMGAISHMAGNMLRAADTRNVVAALTDTQSEARLKFTVSPDSIWSQDQWLQKLTDLDINTDALHRLMSLAEMSTARTRALRFKFQTRQPYTLLRSVEAAYRFLQAMLPSIDGALPLMLDYSRDDVDNVLLPAGYIAPSLLEAFLLEIMLNGSRHGARDSQHRSVRMQLSVSWSQRDRDDKGDARGVFIHADNLLPPNTQLRREPRSQIVVRSHSSHAEYRQQSFLVAAAILAKQLHGLVLSSEIRKSGNRQYYRTTIQLRPLERHLSNHGDEIGHAYPVNRQDEESSC